jgi:hypothetical protein
MAENAENTLLGSCPKCHKLAGVTHTPCDPELATDPADHYTLNAHAKMDGTECEGGGMVPQYIEDSVWPDDFIGRDEESVLFPEDHY